MIIAVTGCIGSGKSLVSQTLAKLANAEICDTDVVCRQALEKDEPGWQGVVKTWGDQYLNEDRTINRPLLRSAIFNDEETREKLEEILHPVVRVHVRDRIAQANKSQQNLIVEVPLLFETGWQGDFDVTITVYADARTCIERVVRRDKVSSEQVEKAIASQMDIEIKKTLADHVIDNAGTQRNTVEQVGVLFSTLAQSF